MSATELLTAEEVAARLRVRPDTIRKWARAGRIPKVTVSPKVVRFCLADVLATITAKPSEEEISARRGGQGVGNA